MGVHLYSNPIYYDNVGQTWFVKLLALAIYPFAVFGSYVYRIVQVLIYAVIGLLFASLCKTTLSYAALIRLAVVAVTPCIIVGTILSLTDASIPRFVYLLAALVYLFFAVKSISGIREVHEGAHMMRPELSGYGEQGK